MVSFVDYQTGQVLEALEESDQREDTLVIYTSDHGEMLGEKGLFFKSIMFESSAAVPFIVAGPGIPQGKVCETPVSHIDMFPTIVDSVGAEYSEEDADLPGRSLVTIAATDGGGASTDRVVLSEYHANGSHTGILYGAPWEMEVRVSSQYACLPLQLGIGPRRGAQFG